MATENTSISSTCPKSDIALSMYARYVPYGLQVLAESMEAPFPHVCFDATDLDEIIAGGNLAEHEIRMDDGLYLDSALARIGWWADLASGLFIAGREEGSAVADRTLEDDKKFRGELLGLFGELLAGYTAALAESPLYSKSYDYIENVPPRPAGLAFLRKYRLYTRSICAAVKAAWPKLDVAWLENHA